MWERDNRSELYCQCYKLQTAAYSPAMMLTGVVVTDYSNASLIGIAFDARKRQWDERMLGDRELFEELAELREQENR